MTTFDDEAPDTTRPLTDIQRARLDELDACVILIEAAAVEAVRGAGRRSDFAGLTRAVELLRERAGRPSR